MVTIFERKAAKKEEAAPTTHFEPKPVNKAPKEEPKPAKEEVKPVEPKEEKKAPVKPAPKVEEAKKEEKQPEPERKKIPGKFIVKTNEGYYVGPNKYSDMKDDAKIFDDYNLAKDIKKEKGGKVVKL